jgi:hypothetical protein
MTISSHFFKYFCNINYQNIASNWLFSLSFLFKGVYINPLNKQEVYSISDAIQKGYIRARILTPPLLNSASQATKTSLNNRSSSSSCSASSRHHIEEPLHTLVSTNRFEENRTYTISGAVDTRTGKKCPLSEAIAEGLINVKNGTYLNLRTGDTMTINRAIEMNLVLTVESDESNNSSSASGRSAANAARPANHKEVRTLNVELIRDPRTGRDISVLEAIKLGLFNSQTLTYYNPLTNECLNLSKAYEKGYVIGHYTTTRVSNHASHGHSLEKQHTHEEKVQKCFFILDVLDARTGKVLNLDEAIKQGIFDYKRGTFFCFFQLSFIKNLCFEWLFAGKILKPVHFLFSRTVCFFSGAATARNA